MSPKTLTVIEQIESQKKDLNLPIRLKERTEYFTSLLFETLFDTESSVSLNIEKLAAIFDELIDPRSKEISGWIFFSCLFNSSRRLLISVPANMFFRTSSFFVNQVQKFFILFDDEDVLIFD